MTDRSPVADTYLMSVTSNTWPEDNRTIEITAEEFAALSAHGTIFDANDGREPNRARRRAYADLLEDIVDGRDEADLRPSDIRAIQDAGRMLYASWND